MATGYSAFLHKEWNPRLSTLFSDIRSRGDRDFFPATGVQIHCGRQGSGKTISAIATIDKLYNLYPKSLLISNIFLKNYRARSFETKQQLRDILSDFKPSEEYILFHTQEQLHIALTDVNNGTMGVMYLIDEMHIYFNSVAEGGSKGIPMFVFTEISQQRKQRKLIVGTSQIFTRLSKPFREQCDNVIICSTLFGYFTKMEAWDGMTLEQQFDGSFQGNHKKTGWFFHTKQLREAFDTFQKVVSSQEQYEEVRKPQVFRMDRKSVIKPV